MLAAISWQPGLRIRFELKGKYHPAPKIQISSVLMLCDAYLLWNSMKISLKNNATLAAIIWHLSLRSVWTKLFFS